jgi:hypothetical protein
MNMDTDAANFKPAQDRTIIGEDTEHYTSKFAISSGDDGDLEEGF